MNLALLFFHFVGLAMGLSVGFSHMVMGPLLARATPDERLVLMRFMPRMGNVGRIGLALLWLTGLGLVFNKWGGFGVFPWQFHAKLTAVGVVTIAVIAIAVMEGQARAGNQAAAKRIPILGMITFTFALVAALFAVLTFK